MFYNFLVLRNVRTSQYQWYFSLEIIHFSFIFFYFLIAIIFIDGQAN